MAKKPRKPDAAEKKPTTGEKIMADSVGRSIRDFRESPMYPMERKTADRIDADIRAREKRVVRKVWNEAVATLPYTAKGNLSPLEARKRRLEAKYGIRQL